MSDYLPSGCGFDSWYFHNFKMGLGLEWGPPNLVRTISKLLIINCIKNSVNWKYRNMNNTKIGIKRGNSYRKNEEISRWEAKINIRKLNWYFSTLIEVFLNQITVCSHTFILCWFMFLFICTTHLEISLFFGKNFPFLLLFLWK